MCKVKEEAYDSLHAVMYMCKEGEGRGEGKFIRMVNAAPHPMKLVRFCTNPHNFSILGVDPTTFNLGEFDVTVTTYRHLLLEPYGTPCGKQPTMIGPMFIHVQKDFGAYHFFTSTLVGQRTDAVTFEHSVQMGSKRWKMPYLLLSQLLRCFLHY